MSSDQKRRFIKYMDSRLGLKIKKIVADGTFHRCGVKNHENGRDGAYAFYPGPFPFGWGANFRTGKTLTWSEKTGLPLNLVLGGDDDA